MEEIELAHNFWSRVLLSIVMVAWFPRKTAWMAYWMI